MKGSIRLARIAGIDIGVHYTWILAFILFAWILSSGLFPQLYPGWSQTTYWILGVIASLLLFVCVLIHEMAHSLVAQSKGMRVQSITLFIFGGVSNIESEPQKAGTEFVMAIAGPASSLVLAAIFFGIWYSISPKNAPPAAILYYLWYINLLLAIFNIIPGFPLDGGRVLRSIIWGATGSLTKATNIAATIGRLFGWLLIAYGVYLLLSGNFLNGLWIAFIGWFLSSAADSSRREVTLQEHLSGVKVKDVMDPIPECLNTGITVDTLVRENFIQRGRRAVPVCYDGKLKGIVTLTDVKKLPHEQWSTTPAESIMTREPLYTVSVNDDLNAALKLLAQHGLNQVPVLSDGILVGLLSRADVIRYLQVSQELGRNKQAGAQQTPGK